MLPICCRFSNHGRVKHLRIPIVAIIGFLSLIGLSACGGSDDPVETATDVVDQSSDESTPSDDDESTSSDIDEDAAGTDDEDPYEWDMFADDEFRQIQGQEIDETIDEGEPEGDDELAMESSPEGDGEELVGEEPVADVDPCTLLTVDEWADIVGVATTAVEQLPLEFGDACGYLESSDAQRVAMGVVSWFVESGSVEADPKFSAEDRYGHPGRESTWDSINVGDSRGQFASGLPVAKSSLMVIALDAATDLVIEVSSTTPNAAAHRELAMKVGAIALTRTGA